MKAHWPTFGSYMVLHNAETNKYPWRECIKNALTFSDTVYILEVDSSQEDIDAIYEELKNVQNVVLKHIEGEWDMDDMAIVGKMKQKARSMVKEDYCIYLDCDEILRVAHRNVLSDLVLNNASADVFAVPYITFFGSPYQMGNFPDMENWWRWKIFRNQPYIGHGVHGAARKYDSNGLMYFDKKMSDGCEIINLQTLEVMSASLFMPPHFIEAAQMYSQVPRDEKTRARVSTYFSETINDFSIVCLHYGWVDFHQKAINGINYWTKTKAFKTGVEHSSLFDGLDKDKIQEKVNEWSEIDTLPLNVRKHPEVMQNKLVNISKPKVLTISLSSTGPHGVPVWNRLLKYCLPKYDVQHFSFNEYVANSPADSSEIQKAESFVKWIQNRQYDTDASVIFADGFWASTYTGSAKVVSVIHGLWSHPLRDKWDDGLIEQRKQLFEYQLDYYKRAKDMGHTLICVSPFIHQILKEEHGIDSILISNAVDLKFWDSVRISRIEKDKPLILHGITSVNKGSDILNRIENHPLIKDKFDIGSIDEIAECGKVEKQFTFKTADVAFLPTKWEASSYLLLECLANNLPVVAYRAGILQCANLSRLDSIGTIVDDYDIDTFAKAIVDTYLNSIKYKMGRVFLQENGMTLDKWATDINKLICEVVG